MALYKVFGLLRYLSFSKFRFGGVTSGSN